MNIAALLIFSLCSNFLNLSDTNKEFDLSGEIGEWDPELNNPFEDLLEPDVDGILPESGDYYTISATIPLNMEFYVITKRNIHGTFYSPVYNITNNGTKNLSLSVTSLVRQDGSQGDDVSLFVEPVVPNDDRTQIELVLKQIEPDAISGQYVDKSIVDLYLLKSENLLIENIKANETKYITFDAMKWELPKTIESEDGSLINTEAKSAFEMLLKFEIKR